TADLQGTAETQGAAYIPQCPNDYTPTDASQTSGEDEGLLDLYALNREVRRLKKQTLSVSSVKLGRNKDESNLSEENNDQDDHIAFVYEDVLIEEEKEAFDVKSGDTEELDLETIKSTARQSTVTPRTLDFDDEAGPSSPIRPTQNIEPEEQLKVDEVLADISRPRGLSIPGPIQSQPQQPTQGTDSKDKGKGILVYEILDRKYPIIDWKTVCLGTKPQPDQAKSLEYINLNVVTRSNGQQRYFSILTTVLSIFDREDLNVVYQLVMDKYQDEMPEGFERVLWGDLMVLFNPDEQDEFWSSQHEWKVISWKLHSSSGVHTLMTNEGVVIHMLTEKKYPLKKEIVVQMLNLKLESEEESTMALELIRFIKKVLADLESEEQG
ncbi:hypothetical protein Tco_0948428, partial [Tanacetum coccineum]